MITYRGYDVTALLKESPPTQLQIGDVVIPLGDDHFIMKEQPMKSETVRRETIERETVHESDGRDQCSQPSSPPPSARQLMRDKIEWHFDQAAKLQALLDQLPAKVNCLADGALRDMLGA